MALGEVDYGLMGVVGGLTAFISFFVGILSGAVGRFYAISVGESQKDPVAYFSYLPPGNSILMDGFYVK